MTKKAGVHRSKCTPAEILSFPTVSTFLLVQLPLGFLRRLLLLDLRSSPYLFGKFLLIGNSKGADGTNGVQNKLPNCFRADIVTAAGVGALLMCQRIGGAIVEVRGIGAALRAAFGTVIGHLRSAVGAEQKSG